MLWIVFSLSFVVALSGAMAPGPLLTYTIVKSLRTRHRGFLTGAWVIAGHAMLESVLVIGLLLGVAELLRSPVTVRIIGALGGIFLVYMGVTIVSNVLRSRVPDVHPSEESLLVSSHPIIGGIVVSMSNPYWWVWWATVGFAFMARYQISLQNWALLLAFFLGHEAGDLAWYLTVSTTVYLGRNYINTRIYGIVLFACGIFVALFGLYLGVSPFLETA